MTDFILMLVGVVIIFPALVFISLAFWTAVGEIGNFLVEKIWPEDPPHCDIDPRCHPRFYLDDSGKGWIGGKVVLK